MVSQEKKAVLELFAQGRELYKERKFEEAKDKFAHALKLDKTDGPSLVYYERCKLYISNPPADDWDGVFVMTTK